jgi:membrane protease YdiL (CAAX protease family)
MGKELSLKKIIFTYVVFISIWSMRIILLKPYIDANYILWIKEIINGLIKSVIWIGFAYYFIKKYDNQLSIKYNQMVKNPIKFIVILTLMGVIVLYHILAKIVVCGGLYYNSSFHPSLMIGSVLLAGVIEELVFRGWFYNGILSFVSENKANLISSIFFVLIHYPSYITAGKPILAILLTSIGIFIGSLIFGWSFKKSKSLWVPIILHMTWNILSITVGV